ncbi:uncharacterized protein [Apostichopus japonicus]|uniref:uncharacterized protein n=1 Tax=Stichopus japonicus TaxID=307972 RepID=UPI003AB72316
MDPQTVMLVVSVLIGIFVIRVEAVTGTLCGTSFQDSVNVCCYLNDYINISTVIVNYTTVRQDSGNPWRLDVNISWQNNPFNRSAKYVVNFDLTISPDDITAGNLPTDLRQGLCQLQFNPYKSPLYPSDSCDVPQQWDIVEEPYYTKQDLLFGFNYRMIIREYDEVVASAYTTCLTGYTYPDLMITPDCFSETKDEEFCQNQPIVVSGAVVNATVIDAYEEVDELNIPSLTILLTWTQPVQVNGDIALYVIEIRNEDTDVYFQRYIPDFNATAYSDMILTIRELPISREEYIIKILPFVTLDADIFTTFGTIREYYNGAERRLHYTYRRPTEPPTVLHRTSSKPEDPANIPSTPNGNGDAPTIWLLFLLSGGAVLLLSLVLVIVTVIYVKRPREKSPVGNWTFQPKLNIHALTRAEDKLALVDDEFKAIEILDYNKIKEEGELGRGQYGVVYKGLALLRGKTTWEVVAMKKPKTSSGFAADDSLDDFKNEIRLLLELGKHPKIVTVKGCCTVEEPFYMITDFLEYGDLLHFLRKCCEPENWKTDPIYKLAPINQVQIAAQVADGMSYVATTRFFHGDLAARNILVGSNLHVKITDFGLTEDLYERGYTRLRADEKRPYKWYGPETMEFQYCNLKTDIWSYGILLWEIYSFGRMTPYRGMTIQEVRQRLKEGFRLPAPKRCPQAMYEIMLACWNEDPDSRPPFSEIFDALTTILEKMGDEYCLFDEDETYIIQQSEARRRKPSLFDSIMGSLNLTDEDYSSWASGASGNGSVFTTDDYLVNDGTFVPIFEEDSDEDEDTKREVSAVR